MIEVVFYPQPLVQVILRERTLRPLSLHYGEQRVASELLQWFVHPAIGAMDTRPRTQSRLFARFYLRADVSIVSMQRHFYDRADALEAYTLLLGEESEQ